MVEYLNPDDVPEGWAGIIGALNAEIKEWHDEGALREFHVVQLKEKYGELTLYYDADVDDHQKFSDMVDAYSHVSAFTCVHCGAFPVRMVSRGWVYPCCEACYNKYKYEHVSYDEATDGDAAWDPVIEIHGYRDGRKYARTIDSSPQLEKVKRQLSDG